jgi:hypothetical protein
MSIRSLAALAVARDKAPPAEPAAGGDSAAAAPPSPGAPAVPQQFVDVLVSTIPTEPLAAYTAIVGITIGAVDVAHPHSYLTFRWLCFAAFLVFTVLSITVAYNRRANGPEGPVDRRRFPWAEGGAAVIAAAAWGLVMPGSPLNVQLTGTVWTLTAASITIGSAAVLALLFAPQLKTGTSSPGD